MPLRFMGKWMYLNNHHEVINLTFDEKIRLRCMFDGKKEIPYGLIWMILQMEMDSDFKKNE